jgi:hypothetical protein
VGDKQLLREAQPFRQHHSSVLLLQRSGEGQAPQEEHQLNKGKRDFHARVYAIDKFNKEIEQIENETGYVKNIDQNMHIEYKSIIKVMNDPQIIKRLVKISSYI